MLMTSRHAPDSAALFSLLLHVHAAPLPSPSPLVPTDRDVPLLTSLTLAFRTLTSMPLDMRRAMGPLSPS